MYVKSDKGDKHYMMSPEDYGSMLRNHITSGYKKGSLDAFNRAVESDRQIATELEIADRVFTNIPREAFGTLKDGKPDFRTNPKMRLLNPTKMELGRVSKQLLEKIVTDVRDKTKLLQWKNTASCLQWFDKIKDKNQCTFIQFDLVDFYGSISKQLLDEAIAWASTITEINEKTKQIIYHCRKNFLIYQSEVWVKKDNPEFDVPMGAYDSAEVCELVVLYVLHKLRHLPVSVALYRDDGCALSRLSAQRTEDAKKDICRIIRELGLEAKVVAVNTQVIDYLIIPLQ